MRSIDFRTRVNEGRLLAELEGFVSFRPTIRNSDNRDSYSTAGIVTPRALNPNLKPQIETLKPKPHPYLHRLESRATVKGLGFRA